MSTIQRRSRHGTLDAGIRVGSLIERDMIAVKLTQDCRWLVVGAPAYFASKGDVRSPEDLVYHECLGYRFATARTVERWRLTDGGHEFHVDPHGSLTVNDTESLIALADEARPRLRRRCSDRAGTAGRRTQGGIEGLSSDHARLLTVPSGPTPAAAEAARLHRYCQAGLTEIGRRFALRGQSRRPGKINKRCVLHCELRRHLAFIKAPLITESCCSTMGWVISNVTYR